MKGWILSVMLLAAPSIVIAEEGKVLEVMKEFVDSGDIAGAVTLVARSGKVLEFDAVGYANLAEKKPMERDSLFWVASMTKPMTAAAILMLVDEGKLSLSDPVSKYLPAFKAMWMLDEKSDDRIVLKRPKREVTIRDLLVHTHGLEEPPMPAEGTPLAEVATSAARGMLQFEPGTQWKYGNVSMSVLGRLVEVVSGESYADFIRKRFFEPLGMKRSTFYPDAKELEGLARTYNRLSGDGPLVEERITLLNGDYWKGTQTVAPGAGLFSTAEDIFRFYQMLLNGGEFEGRRYLSEALVREMSSSQTGDMAAGFSEGMAWGLGVGIVRLPQGWTDVLPVGTWGHDGAYGTTVMMEPESKLLFIMMIQRTGLNPFANGLRIRHAFHSAVMGTYRK